MMAATVPIYQIDAFTQTVFSGNPAAVCPTDAWLDDALMQRLAGENNLSETAFVVPDPTGAADFALRWFTPAQEVDLCGHATLATAWVLFYERGHAADVLTFTTQSGVLTVTRGENGLLTLDLPAHPPSPAVHPDELARALGDDGRGGRPGGGRALDYLTAPNGMKLVVLAGVGAVRDLTPDFAAIARLSAKGLIVTAAAPDEDDVDFVSRYFSPAEGVPEDPVTGAAHTVLVPYWAKRMKKDRFHARQISSRGGDLLCHADGARVRLSGHGVLYLKGEAYI